MTIYIATSADLGRLLRRALREPVCFVPDNWMMGPCGSSPEEHSRVRCDYWELKGRDRKRFLASFREIMEAIDSDQRIVVCMSRLGSDTIALWALCAWRLIRWPNQPNLDLVVMGGPTEEEDATGVGGGSMAHVTPTGARSMLDHVCPLSLARIREMAFFWRRLSGHSPILSGKHDHSAPKRKQLFDLGTYQAGFFPRLRSSGLLLSQFDELLFSCLENQWSSPLDILANEELRKWMDLTGDTFFDVRLEQWAKHNGREAALLSEPYQRPNGTKSARYRLSNTGHAMMQDGLGEIARGVPLPIWGVTAYDPVAPWIVVNDHAEGKRLQRLGGASA